MMRCVWCGVGSTVYARLCMYSHACKYGGYVMFARVLQVYTCTVHIHFSLWMRLHCRHTCFLLVYTSYLPLHSPASPCTSFSIPLPLHSPASPCTSFFIPLPLHAQLLPAKCRQGPPQGAQQPGSCLSPPGITGEDSRAPTPTRVCVFHCAAHWIRCVLTGCVCGQHVYG